MRKLCIILIGANLRRRESVLNLQMRPYYLKVVTCTIFLAICETSWAEQLRVVLSTPQEIAKNFESVPCRNKDRIDGAKTLFESMQAPSSDISVQKFPSVSDLVVRKTGDSQEKIVVGAHYDFAELGCGAVDNWTGIVAMAHVYKAIRTLATRKTVLFVAFGNEEKGLIGSKTLVNAIPKDELSNYCAMINIDSFGLAAPFALEGSSSKKLMALAEELSNQMGISFEKIRITGADSDSTSFLIKKIPAVTLSGLSNEWHSILHTTFDQTKKVNPDSVYLGYRLALAMWSKIDEASCEAFRDGN